MAGYPYHAPMGASLRGFLHPCPRLPHGKVVSVVQVVFFRFLRFNFIDPLVTLLENFPRYLRYLRDIFIVASLGVLRDIFIVASLGVLRDKRCVGLDCKGMLKKLGRVLRKVKGKTFFIRIRQNVSLISLKFSKFAPEYAISNSCASH